MKPAAHAQAAIEVLRAMETLHLPAGRALADWGRAHRFAGSGDRARIGTMVFDVLRRRASLGWAMGDDGARRLVLGWLRIIAGLEVEAIAEMAGQRHGFGALSDDEEKVLRQPRALGDAPEWVRGDYPRWLHESMSAAFGERAAEQGAALARRAPLDMRINTLKATRGKVMKALRHLGAVETPLSPIGARIMADDNGRLPRVEAESAHGRGWFEVMDEGSQIAALACGARPGEQVLDYCAGGGGKTLALAAEMENRGQIFAHDADKTRLRPIFERLKRAGVRNAQVIAPHEKGRLGALEGRMDLVLVDAPCSGSGTWRRKPDAKWRLGPAALEKRIREQAQVLDEAARFVRPGGRLAYVTCSLLREENEEQAAAFMERRGDFSILPWSEAASGKLALPGEDGRRQFLRLSPLTHGCDGFFIAVMRRAE